MKTEKPFIFIVGLFFAPAVLAAEAFVFSPFHVEERDGPVTRNFGHQLSIAILVPTSLESSEVKVLYCQPFRSNLPSIDRTSITRFLSERCQSAESRPQRKEAKRYLHASFNTSEPRRLVVTLSESFSSESRGHVSDLSTLSFFPKNPSALSVIATRIEHRDLQIPLIHSERATFFLDHSAQVDEVLK